MDDMSSVSMTNGSSSSSQITQLPHPFYPLGTEVVGYLANDWSVPSLLGLFAGGWAVILAVTLALVKRRNPQLPGWEKATILWFVLCKYFLFWGGELRVWGGKRI